MHLCTRVHSLHVYSVCSVCMCTCVLFIVCMSVHTYMCTSALCTYVCMSVCVCVAVCLCASVFYGHVHVCVMHVCASVCTSIVWTCVLCACMCVCMHTVMFYPLHYWDPFFSRLRSLSLMTNVFIGKESPVLCTSFHPAGWPSTFALTARVHFPSQFVSKRDAWTKSITDTAEHEMCCYTKRTDSRAGIGTCSYNETHSTRLSTLLPLPECGNRQIWIHYTMRERKSHPKEP